MLESQGVNPNKALVAIKKPSNMTGIQKAAALLIILGIEACSEIFKHLTEDEIERITTEIAVMQHINIEDALPVIQEFCDMIQSEKTYIHGGIEYASNLLIKAFGEDISAEKVARIRTRTEPNKSLEITPDSIESLRRIVLKEHPQTIAVILSSIPQDIASEILISIPQELQTEIIHRIANLSEISPDIIYQIENILKSKVQYKKGSEVGGINAAAELLSRVDTNMEKRIMGSLNDMDPDIASRISELMFTYDDIITITDSGIQRLIQELDEKVLLMALKASTETIKAKILNNMSQRRRDTTQEDLESMPPVKLKDALDAQRTILSVIKRLSQSGMIEIMRDKEDEAYI
ncbi:MAG: flagellar motor switch protein FliG [Euryarchaeota archaeon]|nr:flagellar motor switch protein FliG [Candidatus Gottesmanbacteria bacterium]MBM4242035.1 flagellar motor switch protein FliG [Euryarchaeota archaeon]